MDGSKLQGAMNAGIRSKVVKRQYQDEKNDEDALKIPAAIRYEMYDQEKDPNESKYKKKAIKVLESDSTIQNVSHSISYKKLMDHIDGLHPRGKGNKPFKCCVVLGGFPSMFGSVDNRLSEFAVRI